MKVVLLVTGIIQLVILLGIGIICFFTNAGYNDNKNNNNYEEGDDKIIRTVNKVASFLAIYEILLAVIIFMAYAMWH